MASIYKANNRPYLMIGWIDSTGRRRARSSGTVDRRAAQALAAKLETDSMLEREGIRDPRDDGFRKGARTLLADHVKAFCEFLRHKGDSPKHVADRERQLVRLIAAMKATRVADLTPARAQRGLAELRSGRGISLRTLDRHVRAIKGLTRWLAHEGLVASDSLCGLPGFNADTDRRRVRRALMPNEIAKLLAAAETGIPYGGLAGPERATLYRIALGTGFRVSEIASLTPESFDVGDDTDPPTVTVRAAYSKNRRESVQPIRRDLAAALRPWLAKKPPGAPIFPVKRLGLRTAMMMRRDLGAAKIPYVDEVGRVADFHALRHTYVTEVVRAGASVKEAQTLARHATAELTFKVYAHARLHDLKRTLEAMPRTVGSFESRSVEEAGSASEGSAADSAHDADS